MEQNNEIIVNDIPVKIKRKRNLKNLYIRIIPPKGNVEVSSPISVEDEEVKLFLLKRMPEVVKVRMSMKEQARQSKREYVSGESHYLWGKLYRLQVIYQGRECHIIKKPEKLIMIVPENTSREGRQRLMNSWYRKELARVLENFISICEEKIKVKADEYKIKNMKTRWSSCNVDKKRIWINLQLVKKPIECLEYILIYELIHLIEKNNTDRFNSFIGKVYPTWQETKKALEIMPLEYMKSEVEDDNV